MKRRLMLLLILAATLLLAACGGSDVPDADWTLRVGGTGVDNELTLSYQDLAGMEQTTLTDVLMRKSRGEDQLTSWVGVPVAAVLDQAGVHEDASTVTLIASDGYAIEGTLADLEGAIIALKSAHPDTGEMTWLVELPDAADQGAIRLVAPDKPANFWARQLVEIVIE
jgi:DMSO/TMAO reductase YedYZ molybdopterin-dependent catalytic subunit